MTYHESITQTKGDLPFEEQVELLQDVMRKQHAADTINAQEAVFTTLSEALVGRTPAVTFQDRQAAPVDVTSVTASWNIPGELDKETGLAPRTTIAVEAHAAEALPSSQLWNLRRVLGDEKRVKATRLLGVEGTPRGLLRRKEYHEDTLSKAVGKHILQGAADIIVAAHTDFVEPQHDSNDHVTKAKHAESIDATVGRPGRPEPNSPLLWTPTRLVSEVEGMLHARGRGEDRPAQLYDVENYLNRTINIVPTSEGYASEQYRNLSHILRFVPGVEI